MKKKTFRVVCCLLILALLTATTPTHAASPIDRAGSNVVTDGVIYQNGIYRFRNVKSGLYLGVYTTGNSNGINIIQKAYSATDKTIQFRLFFENGDGESLWPMSMNDGFGRVIDIKRGGKPPATGMNIQTYLREYVTEDSSQLWYIYGASQSDRITIRPKYNTNLAITTYGTSSGGSGTTATSTGNAFVKTLTESDTSQEWYMEYVGQPTNNATSQAAMQSKFIENKYWNHNGGSNDPDTINDNECNHAHGSCDYNGVKCSCNSQDGAIQCMGFARKLTKDVYGTSYKKAGWSKVYNFDSLKAGDVISLINSDHTMVVRSVSGDNIYVVECNVGGRCRIRWTNRVYQKSNLYNAASPNSDRLEFVYVAPYAWPTT